MTRATILLAALIALHGAPAAAHGTCGPRDSFVAQLAMRYGEVRQGGRLPGSIMPREFYGSRRTGTWTVLKSHMRGMSCIFDSGQGWKQKSQAPQGKKSQAPQGKGI